MADKLSGLIETCYGMAAAINAAGIGVDERMKLQATTRLDFLKFLTYLAYTEGDITKGELCKDGTARTEILCAGGCREQNEG